MNPFATIFESLGSSVADRVAAEVKAGLSPVGPYLRRLGLGFVLVLSSLFGWVFGALFFLATLFLYLADLRTYVVPALVTATACWLLALVTVAIGFSFLRRPR